MRLVESVPVYCSRKFLAEGPVGGISGPGRPLLPRAHPIEEASMPSAVHKTVGDCKKCSSFVLVGL